MRARISIFALLLLATLAVSCRKEAGTSRSGIVFYARSTSFVEPDTRTVFSGVSVETGDNKKTERIDWVEGDLIRVYCAEASLLDSPSTHFSDYTVTGQSSGGATCTATITSSAGNGLQWGSGSHTFYAMYPSPSTEDLSGVTFNNGTMVLTIPATQTVTRKGTTGTWLPDMRYAPMLAKTTAETTEGSVGLDFAPQYSAFTFTVGLGAYESLSLTGFTLTSTTGNLTGKITVNASDYGTATVSGGGKSITIDLTGMTLNASNPSATFTVLAVPEETSGLQVSFTGEQIGTRTLALNRADGTPLTFQAYKKYNLGGFTFPVLVDGSVDDPIDWDHNVSVSDYMSWYSLARVGEGLNWDNVRIALSSTTDAYLWSGGTLTRTVSARDGIGAPYTDVEVYWASSATGVAKVDAVTGVVTAVAPGTATITAYAWPADGSTPLTASYTVYVNQAAEVTIASSAGDSFAEGASSTLTATVAFTGNSGAGYGSAIPMPSDFLSWSSGNTGVVSLSDTQAQPGSNRQATATATAVSTGSAVITVAVNAAYAASVSGTLTLTVTEAGPVVTVTHEVDYMPGVINGYRISQGYLIWDDTNDDYNLSSGDDPLELVYYYGDNDALNVYYHQFNDCNAHANEYCLMYRLTGSYTPQSLENHSFYDYVNGEEWFLPTVEALQNIFTTERDNTTVNGNPALWAYVRVDNLPSTYSDIIGEASLTGVLLFPDHITVENSAMTGFGEFGTGNVIDYAEFEVLTTEGCLFLPCVGYKNPSVTDNDGWVNGGVSGHFWTAYFESDYWAPALMIEDLHLLTLDSSPADCYFPVKLIQYLAP